jgi:hypothetical protein
MDLKLPDKVATQINKMRTAEKPRADQRKLLNDFFNGEAPWTKKEATDNHVLINFNDKQGANLLHQARNQYENAFAKRDTFFKVFLPDCKDDRADEYAETITRQINRIIKSSREYYYTMDECWGGICLHGIGMRVWHDDQHWKPSFTGIQDVLIPTETHLGMDNLQCFAVRRRMRYGELLKKTVKMGKNVNPGWNMPVVRKLLDEYKDMNENPNNYNWTDNPEQMGEIWKQSSGGYDVSDVAPTIDFWDFYHREEGGSDLAAGWYLKMMLDKDCVSAASSSLESDREFIFESKTPIAPNLSQIIHFQFGDGNNVPPFMYHSIRSLAYLTYDLVWTMNRLNCQFTQHMFEQLMTMVRVQDPADRGRLNKVVLTPPFCIIPEGLNLVAGNERYHADYNLIESGLANYRQRIGDLTSAYTQQLDKGPSSEARTKFEVQSILAQTSALMASMLGRAYRQEHWACVEIARRFTIPNSHDFDVKHFQNACILDGVPGKYLDSKLWQIEVEQVLGNGNRAMELAEATELFTNLGAFDPAAQQEIKHDWALAITGNSKKAARLAPTSQKPKATSSVVDAQNKFGSLWVGAELDPVDGMNHTEQVTTMFGLMAGKIQQITQGLQPDESDMRGFGNVATFIAKHLKLMSGDEKMIPLVKKFTEDLNQIMQIVQKIAAEQPQPGQEGPDPETMAKVEAITATTQAKIQSKQASDAVKMQNSQTSTQLKLAQKQQSHQQKLEQNAQSHQMQEAMKAMSAKHDEHIKAMQAQNDMLIAKIEAALKPKPEAKSEQGG